MSLNPNFWRSMSLLLSICVGTIDSFIPGAFESKGYLEDVEEIDLVLLSQVHLSSAKRPLLTCKVSSICYQLCEMPFNLAPSIKSLYVKILITCECNRCLGLRFLHLPRYPDVASFSHLPVYGTDGRKERHSIAMFHLRKATTSTTIFRSNYIFECTHFNHFT